MPKFAIYYIPPLNSEFYQKGSEILTWNIRTESNSESTLIDFPIPGGFSKEWVLYSRQYGFHMTIGDALDFEMKNIDKISEELIKIMSLFRKSQLPSIKPAVKLAEFRGESKSALVLGFEPDQSLIAFHSLIVALIHPLGTGSLYSSDPKASGLDHWEDPADQMKIQYFNTPTAFDNYRPHFTLLNPYTGDHRSEIISFCNKLFSDIGKTTVDTVSLVVKEDGMDEYKIHKEFSFDKVE